MANKKKEVTKAPTGMKITRNGNKFTASWKIGDKDYGDGQYLQYLINDTGKDKWQPTADSKKSIGVKVTSKAISIDKADFYPNKDKKGNNKPSLYEIGFRVKGNRKKYTTGSGKKKKDHNPTSSEWTEKRFTVNPPKKPTLTVELDEELTNVCKFSWSAPYASDDSYIFTDTQWQTILVKNNSETDGSKLSWKGSTFDEGTAGAESSKTITEDTAILYMNGNSYTRWFRVRARGPRGVMNTDGSYGWVYKKHVYALPNKTNVTGTSAKETDEGGFQCIVDWTVGQSNGQKPIDKVTVQYTIVVPDENLTCPNGASWTDANISRDTSEGDAAVFSIDDQLGKDQCLFIRVNTQHDSNITYGKPQLSSVGFLKDPTGLSVQTDNVTHKATINATNVSDVEDSVLVVRYVPAAGDPIDVGIIPHNSSSITVQCPDWSEQSAIGFEVYAMVGEATKQTRQDGVDSYAVTPKMRSQNTVSQGGAVPVAPQNVNVSRVDGKPDTVQVTWDWPWSEAGSAEISWSDHDDAWESTDEPESFLISNLHASKWNISGLETGKTWYVRVRLIAGNMNESETVTYGPWSDISQGSIDLSSAPNKPVLILSDSIIPEDGSTTASWVYTTTDNTAQAYAEVAVVENGEYIPIAHALSAQHVTIDAVSAGFTTGNVYNLACMVKSASGRNSEWSDVVSVAVAEPLECDIPVSSLVFESKETNPREFEGNPIEFDTELNENIRKLEIALEPTQLGECTPSPSNVRPIIGTQKVNVLDEGKNLADQRILLNLNPAVTYTDEEGYYLPKHYDTGFQALLFKNTKGIEGQMTLSFLCKTSDGVEGGYLQLYYTDGTRTRPNSPELRHDEFHLITIVSPADKTVDRVAYGYYTANKPTWFKNVQLELGAEATDYVPYIEPIEISQEFDVSLTPTVIDRIPYNFKATGDVRGDRLSQDLVGGTVNWNQLAKELNGDNFSTANATVSYSSGVATVTPSAVYGILRNKTGAGAYIFNNHKYLMSCDVKSVNDTDLQMVIGDNTYFTSPKNFVGTTSWGNYCKVFSIPDVIRSETIYWGIRSGATATLSEYQIKNIQLIDLTQMFGTTIADYINSLEQSSSGEGVAWFKRLFSKPYYAYNAGQLMSVKPTAHKTIGKNQIYTTKNAYVSPGTDAVYLTGTGTSLVFRCIAGQTYTFSGITANRLVYGIFPSEPTNGQRTDYFANLYASPMPTSFTTPIDGVCVLYVNNTVIDTSKAQIEFGSVATEYELYDGHTYEISELELRGFPTVVDGELRFDGDTRKADGNVSRKYGRISDLGQAGWAWASTGFFYITISDLEQPTTGEERQTGVICAKYQPSSTYQLNDTMDDKSWLRVGNNWYVKDTSFNGDISSFKASLSGYDLVYKKSSPTIETAPTFADPQVCSIYGTEEFVDEREVPIPVGHVTTYKTRDIFGGTIDLKTGLLTLTHAINLYDGSELWTKDSDLTGGIHRFYLSDDTIKKYSDYSNVLLSNKCKAVNNYQYAPNMDEDFAITAYSIFTNSFNWAYIFSKTIDNANDLKTWLSDEPLQFWYPLATPTTYQLTPHELETLIGKNTVSTENGNMSIRIAESYEDGYFLTEMPLEATVTGIEEGGKISVVVERAEDYKLDRPNEDEFNGYAGETILQKINSNPVIFDTEEMTGSLDDGAKYNLIATIQDGLGQKAEKVLSFTVKWEHQAIIPSANIVIDEEELIAKIQPIAPQGADPTDVADIYRLSADKPELIYSGATFGEWYVDPYPALGDMGGHRIVLRTKNGDYITEDNQIAMVDSPELGVNPLENEDELNIIDFDGRQIQFYFDTDYSNTWAKDFQETQYLGGSIQGDWNPAVSRSGTLSSQAITVLDQEMLKNVRRLAEHSGICHVRTADGSSYAADVQVSEDRVHDDREMLVNYSLSITRVDSQGFDGMTLESWESEYPDDEEEEEVEE